MKIAAIYKTIYKDARTELTFTQWSSWIDRSAPQWIGNAFADRLMSELRNASADRCTIESLYGEVLARQLKRIMGDRFKVVFLDLDYETRLKRQMRREGFETIREARELMDPRDAVKREWGVDRVEKMADFVVGNDGTLPELHEKLRRIAANILDETRK